MNLSPSGGESFHSSTLLSEATELEDQDYVPLLPKILRKDLTN